MGAYLLFSFPLLLLFILFSHPIENAEIEHPPGENGECPGPNETVVDYCTLTIQPSCNQLWWPNDGCASDAFWSKQCVCIQGYVRAGPSGEGQCIPGEKCPAMGTSGEMESTTPFQQQETETPKLKCLGANEQPGRMCVRLQQPSCDNPEPRGDEVDCMYLIEGCICREGYIRMGPNGEGQCVQKEECGGKITTEMPGETTEAENSEEMRTTEMAPVSLKCGGGNEMLVRGCRHNLEPTCHRPNPTEHFCLRKDLILECRCKPGYIRLLNLNGKGKCVRQEECPRKRTTMTMETTEMGTGEPTTEMTPKGCGENEDLVPSCDIFERTCGNLDEIIHIACKPVYMKCECRDGYVRREEKGECVKVENCPGQKSTTMEEMEGRTTEMPTDEEPSREMTTPAWSEEKCEGENEEMEQQICTFFEPSCDNLSPFPRRCDFPMPGKRCECRFGYVRRDPFGGGECVKLEDCPQGGMKTTTMEMETEAQETGELPMPTTQSPSSPEECENENEIRLKVCAEFVDATCTKPPSLVFCGVLALKCICRFGYVRSGGGGCIKWEECGHGEMQTTMETTKMETEEPTKGGKSSEETTTPEFSEPFFDHCSFPAATCQFPIPPPTPCRLQTIPPRKCRCRPGFVRLSYFGNGSCIEQKMCPSMDRKCEDPNEILEMGCPGLERKHQPACENPGKKVFCPVAKEYWVPKCVCREGYLRNGENGEGECVQAEMCPNKKCHDRGDGRVERLVCPNWQEPSCMNPIPTRICTQRERVRKCVCPKGHLYRYFGTGPADDGICVPKEDCGW